MFIKIIDNRKRGTIKHISVQEGITIEELLCSKIPRFSDIGDFYIRINRRLMVRGQVLQKNDMINITPKPHAIPSRSNIHANL